ncbi:homocysteine S-methyltransferase family protein [Tabrizicola sp.]|uniref:homocysteine S-methyltransferase family protein n=1 Tax=Tabrizicola sp. TaxID=2005166 RepID=UPI00286B86E2|nr:homocysteine S-methyltransferase family protein [Tabrizicola sp.]
MSRVEKLMKADRPWIADAGLETVMIFLEGIDLPHFASFTLLDSDDGRAALTRYFDHFVQLARDGQTGLVLDTATWRANMGWAAAMGLDADAIRSANQRAVSFAQTFRNRVETDSLPILVNGVVGPAGDGYRIDTALAAAEAEALHAFQIDTLAQNGVDLISAVTMTYPAQAIGIARAATRHGLPHILSFTVETDGRLPNGQSLSSAIAEVETSTGGSPLFYMVNCAHPTHFSGALKGDWVQRIGGIRANASRLSHAELDIATELDDGNPAEFGVLYRELGGLLPNLRVIGGCCGSDHRHVGAAVSSFASGRLRHG